jgi:GGDEF domain-containing protein
MQVDFRLLETLAQAAAARAGRDPARLPAVLHYARELGRLAAWDEERLHDLWLAAIRQATGELAAPPWMLPGQWPAPGCLDASGDARRILAVADCLAVLPRDEALAALQRGRGTAFDAALVDLASAVLPVSVRNTDSLAPFARAAERERLLRQLLAGLGASLSLPETMAGFDAILGKLIAYGSLALWTPRGGSLVAAYVKGEDARRICSQEIPYGEGVSAEEAATLTCDGQERALAIPLERGCALVAVLSLYRRGPETSDDEDRALLLYVRDKLATCAANAIRYEALEKLATQDAATSLPNERALFVRLDAELARCRRNDGRLAVLVCEPGTRGAGLAVLAGNLRRVCREEDFVARMGDRFVLVLGGFRRAHLAEKRNQLENFELTVGSAFYPEDGADAEDLLAAADARLSQPERDPV